MNNTSHYYSKTQESAHDEREFTWRLRGMAFRFVTDAGVFSKERVDYGSELLINSMRVNEDDIVLDLGCGYGPIGIVAAVLASRGRVYLVDVNERAVELAERNLKLNGITNAEVRQGEGFEPVKGIPFTLVLTNPPIRAGKAVVYGLLEDAHRHLVPGGRLEVVVRTKQGAKTMKRKIEEIFGNADEIEKGGGYRVIEAVKESMESVKEKEPAEAVNERDTYEDEEE